MSGFDEYWRIHASGTRSADDEKSEWSAASLANGILRHALTGVARLLSQNISATPVITETIAALPCVTGLEYHGYRFVVCGVEDTPGVLISTMAREIVERSREAIALVVLPSVTLDIWSLISHKWPARTATVIPLYPADVDALASGSASVLDLIQFKLYRRLVLDKPAANTQFDRRLFGEFIAARAASGARVEDLENVLQTGQDENWIVHPLLDRVRTALERGRGCLLGGPSSSGKSVLALQVGRAFLLGGRGVGYISLGRLESNPAPLFTLFSSQSPGSHYSILIVDDLQSSPAVARYFLAVSSAGRRVSLTLPPLILATSWVDFSREAVAWFEDCLPVAIRSHQIRQRLVERYREALTEEDIARLAEACGDDMYLLRLSLDESSQRGHCVEPQELAREAWEARTAGAAVNGGEARRVGLVAASLGRFDIASPQGFLRHEARASQATLQALMRSGLLRRHQENLSIGHRSLCGLFADWLDQQGVWQDLDRLEGPRTTGGVVLDYLRSLGSSLAVDSLRALHARAGFKDRPKLNRRAAALVELWDAFNDVLERIEYQQAQDPSWGNVPSSAMFAVIAFSEVGRAELARDSVVFLRRHWGYEEQRIVVDTAGLATADDFDQIRGTMQEEDEAAAGTPPNGTLPASEIDMPRFHQTWVSGVILCTEAAAQDGEVSLEQLSHAVELSQLPSGAFYPERVPWCTARVLLGLAACGRTADTSPAVAKAVKWLLRDRKEGGASTSGLWQSGTGRWNSTLETTGMVLLSLAAVGFDCSDEALQTARAYLLSQKNRWASPGRELDGALAIQALLDTGSSWEDVAVEAQALSRWARGEALWQGALRSAKESFDQSCRVAQIASHLISIGWSAIRTDLPAFLDALATPDLFRPKEQIERDGREKSLARELEDEGPQEVNLELEALRALRDISLRDSTVVGEYRRSDERIRNALRDWRLRIQEPLLAETCLRENFLIWAGPGSGKTFFIQQIAAVNAPRVHYFELNLARLALPEFRQRLEEVRASTEPVLCLLDEIDARADERWPYEECFSDLDINIKEGRAAVFVLIGSSPSGMQGLIQSMLNRSKGKDLLDRIPSERRFEIPSLTLEDQVIVVASHVAAAAKERGQLVREIERLALYYILRNPELRTPRQLRDLAVGAVQRMSGSDDRLKYDDLFTRGDVRSKMFWVSNQDAAGELSDTFLRINA